jgi:hypothetical protein
MHVLTPRRRLSQPQRKAAAGNASYNERVAAARAVLEDEDDTPLGSAATKTLRDWLFDHFLHPVRRAQTSKSRLLMLATRADQQSSAAAVPERCGEDRAGEAHRPQAFAGCVTSACAPSLHAYSQSGSRVAAAVANWFINAVRALRYDACRCVLTLTRTGSTARARVAPRHLLDVRRDGAVAAGGGCRIRLGGPRLVSAAVSAGVLRPAPKDGMSCNEGAGRLLQAAGVAAVAALYHLQHLIEHPVSVRSSCCSRRRKLSC